MSDWLAGNRRFLLRLLGTLLAVILIYLLIKKDWKDVVEAWRQLSLSQLLVALALVLLSRFFVSLRWYILLRSGGVKISLQDSVSLTFTGLFSNNFLPTTIGGDVVRLTGAMQMGYDRAVCLASIAADRLIGMAGMLFTLHLGLIPTWNVLGHGAISSFSIAIPALWERFKKFIRRTLQTFSIWLKQPWALLAALVCTWGHMFSTFATLYLLIQGLHSHIDFWLIAGLWTISYFITLVPISINGYGVQELSLTFLFSTVGHLSTAAGITMAVLIRVLYLVASLPGAVYMPAILAAMDADRTEDKS